MCQRPTSKDWHFTLLPPATLTLKGTRPQFMFSLLLDHKLSNFNSQISNFTKDQASTPLSQRSILINNFPKIKDAAIATRYPGPEGNPPAIYVFHTPGSQTFNSQISNFTKDQPLHPFDTRYPGHEGNPPVISLIVFLAEIFFAKSNSQHAKTPICQPPISLLPTPYSLLTTPYSPETKLKN